MKYEREYLLIADLKEVIYGWARNLGLDADRFARGELAEQIFYFLLHSGDLKEERPKSYNGKKWLVDITGLTDKEVMAKLRRSMGEISKMEVANAFGIKPKELSPETLRMKLKYLKMKVDADSPFKEEVI